MLKFNTIFVIISLILITSVSKAFCQGQSVYFHKLGQTGGSISTVPVGGPSSAIKELVSGINVSVFGGLSRDGSGNILFTDSDSARILLSDKNGKTTELVSASAGLNTPQGITFDSKNKYIYIFDSGNQRIVRADLSGKLPVTSVEVVVPQGNTFSILITDIKYNSADSMLYWSTGGLLVRATVNSVTLPLSSVETLSATGSAAPSFFDFDSEIPQNIYFADISSSEGIYKAPVPLTGVTTFVESLLYDVSSLADFIFVGLALDPVSNILCFSAFDGTSQSLSCGDRSSPGTATKIFNNEFLGALSALVIDESPSVVSPSTQPSAPVVNVDITGKKPQAQIILEAFTGAILKSQVVRALSSVKEKNTSQAKSSGKLGFQYAVEVKRPTDASGNPLKKKDQDIRKFTSKKNILTLKNLKPNSDYDIKYRVEITSKSAGQDPKVVKRTPYSPTIDFIIP